MPVVKAEFGLFQVQFQGLAGSAVELGEPPCSIAPERRDTVDVVVAPGKFALAVVNTQMLVEADVDQAVGI